MTTEHCVWCETIDDCPRHPRTSEAGRVVVAMNDGLYRDEPHDPPFVHVVDPRPASPAPPSEAHEHTLTLVRREDTFYECTKCDARFDDKHGRRPRGNAEPERGETSKVSEDSEAAGIETGLPACTPDDAKGSQPETAPGGPMPSPPAEARESRGATSCRACECPLVGPSVWIHVACFDELLHRKTDPVWDRLNALAHKVEAIGKRSETASPTPEAWRMKSRVWREDMDRIAEALGMLPGANYGDILGQIDELRAERQSLADLSVTAQEYADAPTPGMLGNLQRSLDRFNARFHGVPEAKPCAYPNEHAQHRSLVTDHYTCGCAVSASDEKGGAG